MVCPVLKIDSNLVGLSYAEELCLKVLPDTAGGNAGNQAGGVWYPLDPNEYDDFGGDVTTTARNPINASRQRRKGVVTDLEASGGFQQDLTQSNLTRIMQGFFFADAHERVGNKPYNASATSTDIVVNIVATGSKINVTVGTNYQVGDLLKLSGWTSPGNNVAVTMVTAIATNELTVDATGLVSETFASSPAGKIEKVGFQHAASDLGIILSGNLLTLTSTVGFTPQKYQVGEWIFVGGDAAAEKFTLGATGQNVPGYARIEAVAANTLTLKEPTWTPLTNTGVGKTIRIYTGIYLRNEKTPSLIKRRSYQIERTLGNDANGLQSEVLVGSVPNEFTMNFDSADKVMVNLSFIALSNEIRSGSVGLKSGNRTNVLPLEDAYNTVSDVYQQRLYVHGSAPTPVSLFAYVTQSSLTLNNNATGLPLAVSRSQDIPMLTPKMHL